MIQDRDRWYTPGDIPAGRVHIDAWWMVHGVPKRLEVVRVWMPRDKAYQWYTQSRRGDIVLVPPRGAEGSFWGEAPVCWQPLTEAWTWPNGVEPEPAPVHSVPKAISIGRQSYAEVEEASGERDAGGRGDSADDVQWWRDATQIAYERPGAVSMRMAEGRLMRALAHCGAINPRLHAVTTASLLADLAAHADAEARVAAALVVRFQPMPKDHDDFLMAMAWFSSLNTAVAGRTTRRPWSLNRRQRVLHYRSMDQPLSFADIGHELSTPDQRRRGNTLSRHRVMQIYWEGIEAVHRVANRT